MATTLTASLALSTYTPPRPHIGSVTLAGTYDGAGLSASGSGLLFLAKIPPDCSVVVIEDHSTGASTQVLNIGIRAAGGSLTVSALAKNGAGGTAGQTNIHGPYTCTREDTTNEAFKYVVASLQSGSVTASQLVRYLVTYSLQGNTTN